MERNVRVELTLQVWKTHVLTDIRIPLKSFILYCLKNSKWFAKQSLDDLLL